MRAAQVIGTFKIAEGGGAQRLAYNLALGIRHSGASSYAIALRARGAAPEESPEGVKLFALDADPRKPWTMISAFVRLRRLIVRERLAVLHVHGSPSLPFVVLAAHSVR